MEEGSVEMRVESQVLRLADPSLAHRAGISPHT